jgi:mono/diheme cytochrome c family protein
LLAQADGFSPVTVRSCGEGLDALSRGDVDVAFLWGPEAGYLNAQRYNSRWRITPVRAAGLQTDLVVALRSGETELLQHVNGALGELEPKIREISRKYAFPDGDPIETALDNVGPDTVTAAVRAEDPGPAVSPAGDAVEGKAFFNNTCSHCHAPNGQSPLQERDLRRLTNRYGDNWMDVAKTTIREGRQELGMPTWKDVLSEQDLQNVLSFLATIQNY